MPPCAFNLSLQVEYMLLQLHYHRQQIDLITRPDIIFYRKAGTSELLELQTE